MLVPGNVAILCLPPVRCEFLCKSPSGGEGAPAAHFPGSQPVILGRVFTGGRWEGPGRKGPKGSASQGGDTPEPVVLNLMKALVFPFSGLMDALKFKAKDLRYAAVF